MYEIIPLQALSSQGKIHSKAALKKVPLDLQNHKIFWAKQPLNQHAIGQGWTPPPLRDSTPCRPERSPLCTILRYPCLVANPENFLKVPMAPKYTNFEGERAQKKKQFFGQNFPKKGLKTPFSARFFYSACGAESLAKTVFFSALWELGKSI